MKLDDEAAKLKLVSFSQPRENAARAREPDTASRVCRWGHCLSGQQKSCRDLVPLLATTLMRNLHLHCLSSTCACACMRSRPGQRRVQAKALEEPPTSNCCCGRFPGPASINHGPQLRFTSGPEQSEQVAGSDSLSGKAALPNCVTAQSAPASKEASGRAHELKGTSRRKHNLAMLLLL